MSRYELSRNKLLAFRQFPLESCFVLIEVQALSILEDLRIKCTLSLNQLETNS